MDEIDKMNIQELQARRNKLQEELGDMLYTDKNYGELSATRWDLDKEIFERSINNLKNDD